MRSAREAAPLRFLPEAAVMTSRLLIATAIALPCALGAHLTAILLFAVAVAVVGLHLLPVLVPVALIGAVLFLASLITLTILRDGFGCAPTRRAMA
jgi:hypothetical protein